jgi:hypothetical protein
MFVTHEEDHFATMALAILEQRGYPVRVLTGEEYAQEEDVVLFSTDGNEKVRYPNRHSRLAAHRLLQSGIVPGWALTSLYPVAIRKHPNPKCQATFEDAILRLAARYNRWFSGIAHSGCPWGCEPTGEYVPAFKDWQRKALPAMIDFSEKTAQFFAHLEPVNGECLRVASERIRKGNLRAMTVFCPHCDEARRGIINQLNWDLVKIVVRIIDSLPVERVDVLTFHPDDWDILEQCGFQEILFDSLWGKKDQLEKHWRISQEIVGLSSKMELHPLRVLFQDENLISQARQAAELRSGKMVKKLMKDPLPALQCMGRNRIKERVISDIALYLLTAKTFSQSIYIGLEVKPSYWRVSEVYRWEESFLPAAFLPECLRQHWGNWAVDKRRLNQAKALLSV